MSMAPTMQRGDPRKPRVLVDADVLLAGSASPSEHSASLVILRMAEITLIEALTSQQVITECERNLEAKLPDALPIFRLMVSRCLRVIPDPAPEVIQQHVGLAGPKGLSILVAALSAECCWLATFNTRHFQTGHPAINVLRPDELMLEVRGLLSRLGTVGGLTR